MEIQFKPVPSGDMAGSLAHFIKNFDYDNVEEVADLDTKLVVLYDDGASVDALRALRSAFSGRGKNPTIALVTRIPLVQFSWYAVDRVIVVTTLERYVGIPANEIHIEWKPGDTTYPVVAPLGAQQTHIYATTDKGNFSALIEWAKKAPYPIGVIPRAL